MGDETGDTERGDDQEDVRDLDPREAQRMRRRDHDLDSAGRALLRPGMGKVFKQIQDAQRRAADELAGESGERRPKPVRRRTHAADRPRTRQPDG